MDVETVTGNIYTLSLPDNYVRVDSMVELYELIPRKKKYVKENLRMIQETVILWSKMSERYFERDLRGSLEAHIRVFVHKGYLYMPEGRKPSESTVKEREARLMLEYYTNDKSIQGRETKLKLLRDKLKTLKT